ncbi:hypothetical protein NKH77_43795 [Streptomyces sp. M19]
MVPLGGGLLGMASDTRAWVALPDACTVEPDEFSGPGVVDVALGDDEINRSTRAETNARYQKALARTAVHVANGTLRELGCGGSLDEPGELPPRPTRSCRWPPTGGCAASRRCGCPRRTRARNRGRGPRSAAPPARAPSAAATSSRGGLRPQIRLTTVQEEALTGAFGHTVLELGDHVTSKDEAVEVSGTYSAATAAVYAECPKGAVVFLAEDQHDIGATPSSGTSSRPTSPRRPRVWDAARCPSA